MTSRGLAKILNSNSKLSACPDSTTQLPQYIN